MEKVSKNLLINEDELLNLLNNSLIKFRILNDVIELASNICHKSINDSILY